MEKIVVLEKRYNDVLKSLSYITYSISVLAPTPRTVFLEAKNVNVIHEKELATFFAMVEDRNITSHTYNEALAEEIKNRLPRYLEVMRLVLNRITLPK